MLTGIRNGRAGLYLQGLRLPSSSHNLSCLLHLLIDSAIALAGMAADSDPLGSGRAPTGDAAEPSSPFTCGSATRQVVGHENTQSLMVHCHQGLYVYHS